MSYLKDILGGLLIALVAGVIGVAQNAVRDDGIPLFPRPSATHVGKEEGPASSVAHNNPVEGRVFDAPPAEAAPGGVPTDAELSTGRVTRDRLRALLESGAIVLIDARPAREYEAGHIAGAISVPYEQFADRYNTLGETIPYGSVIVCYCQSETCDDSENLARELKFMGYQKVLLYKGGWDEWSVAGYPAVPTTTVK
jgi:rhodanese-related sulfurtransferase